VKKRLTAELEMVHAEIASIHDKKVGVLLRKDFAFDVTLTKALEELRERRHRLFEELEEHLAQHHC
jgi:hypothetical protein